MPYQQMPNQSEVLVERSVRNGLMVMRYIAMAMVLDDTNYLEERLRGLVARYGQSSTKPRLWISSFSICCRSNWPRCFQPGPTGICSSHI
jgi:hypothetical protein